ncbi:flagellar basal body rod protein FlgG [Caldifermentibacillus hisashii]|nr:MULTISPECIES: flagellar basal body rod protein FlgG [Bacillaceae]MBU5341117.1 flagellar basal body rod protein FlgG [Caldifermentibacillus hisashii]MED3642562.1 flagellar basal body rod protein FlgG [Caldifermentibacillus hisashii]PAC38079.1 flagellar basal body rod protein FlgG [Caldifermentibacillus hisashii]
MLRSMYSGISGMKNMQIKLDVIGNNIANVNTFGFKKGRITFKDAMYQTIGSASGGTATRGGINAKQVGLGSEIASIDTIHTESSMQNTSRPLDLAITNGDGYFVVNDGGQTYFTRAGNFYIDDNGNLVNSDGYKVQGYDPNTNDLNDILIERQINDGGDTLELQGISISQNGEIIAQYNDNSVRTIATIALARFSNEEGLNKVGGNLYQRSTNSGDPIYGIGGGAHGTVVSGKLEMSNVDLSEEFTEMIVAQRGFQANSRIITTSDEILQELVNLKR